MLVIEHMPLLGVVVDQAMDTVQSKLNGSLRDRWLNAIIKAANFLRNGELPFVTYNRSTNELLMLAKSNKIYSTEKTCGCQASMVYRLPCYHKAMARLIRRYYEAVDRGEAPMIRRGHVECAKCGWNDTLLRATNGASKGPVCPKCDSTEFIEPRMVPPTAAIAGYKTAYIGA